MLNNKGEENSFIRLHDNFCVLFVCVRYRLYVIYSLLQIKTLSIILALQLDNFIGNQKNRHSGFFASLILTELV